MKCFISVLGYIMCDHKTNKELREMQNKIILDSGSYRTQYLLGMSGIGILKVVYGYTASVRLNRGQPRSRWRAQNLWRRNKVGMACTKLLGIINVWIFSLMLLTCTYITYITYLHLHYVHYILVYIFTQPHSSQIQLQVFSLPLSL
jgi:hypothetical protein